MVATFYMEGKDKDDYMVVRGVPQRKAVWVYALHYGNSPHHMVRIPEDVPFAVTDKHVKYEVVLPRDMKVKGKKEYVYPFNKGEEDV